MSLDVIFFNFEFFIWRQTKGILYHGLQFFGKFNRALLILRTDNFVAQLKTEALIAIRQVNKYFQYSSKTLQRNTKLPNCTI